MSTNRNMLDYLITDFLEIHFSQDKEILFQVKKKLFSRPLKVQELSSSPCLVLEHAVVVVQDKHMEEPTELLFLNAKEHSFKVFTLK